MAPTISTLAELSYGLLTLSVSILKKAREEAAKTHQYSSAETRRCIIDEFARVFDGRQLTTGKSMLQKQSCSVLTAGGESRSESESSTTLRSELSQGLGGLVGIDDTMIM
ncbi:hypothetical protein IEO21_07067 [Rhodonia placenta]|uniref:Uncharacterized protein n=1 Tax=Rhodonia placenta TaxID=104341 RepID=A0A8H7NYU6_9APHY|nr:hypothetical protein IEO21_07067 [Postia placenta]